MEKGFSRRKFILTSAAATAGFAALGFNSPLKNYAPSDTVRVGLIGSGRRGSGIAHVLKNLPGIELTACCDTIQSHLEKGMGYAARGAKAYTDYQKLLTDRDVDAVIIATPLHLHYQMALDAIEAGKHIYLEKTMAYDIPQTQDLARKVKNSDLVFQVGHQYRYYALYHKIYEAISQGWCGDVLHFESQYHSNLDWRRPVADPEMERLINWRMYREYSGGVLAELSAHQIDVVNWMLGSKPVKVTGLGGINYWRDGRETYDHARTLYEYPDGVKSSVSSILTNAFRGYSIRILGTKATIEVQRDKAYIYPESKKEELGIVDGVSGATVKAWTQGDPVPVDFEQDHSPTASAFLAFADCVRNDKEPFSNAKTGSDVAIAVHMGNLAMREEKVQYWKPEYSQDT